MKNKVKHYLSNIGMCEEHLEMLDELGATPIIATPDMFLSDEAEDYIEKGTDIIQQLGEYEILQISQSAEMTLFFLYKEGVSNVLKLDRCLVFGYNNYTGEFSGVGCIPIVVEDGKYISIRQ